MSQDIRWVKTHCSRMDHGGCALLVGVAGNRIVDIKGDPEGFLNKGYICPKGLAGADRLTHPKRLVHPLRRTGKRGEGKWQRISWNEAIDEISRNFIRIKQEHGARAVIFGQGMPKGLDLFVLTRLATAFGSPNVLGVQDVCHAPREVTGLHTCGFYPVADLHHPTRLAVLWGSNPTSTNEEGEICTAILQRIREGTELIVIDPRKTELARKARLFLQVRPGTDSALALALLNVIIEEGLYHRAFVDEWTSGFRLLAEHVKDYPPEKVADIAWVPADLIREAARLYASSHPAAIQWGNALEHNIHTFHALRGIVCLMGICGNLDVAGGNVHSLDPETLSLAGFVRAELLPQKAAEMLHASQGTIPRLMTVPPSHFRRAVLEGIPYPIRAAYFQGTNSILAYAESRMTFEALTRLDFLAVAEIVMTPTADLADIVLPAATSFEFNDIGNYGLGHGFILARPKVVDPPEECWPDIKILNELGRAMTSPEYWHADYEGLLEEVLGPSRLTYREFAEKGFLKGPERYRKYLASGFKTPSGKVELCLSRAEKLGVPPLALFPGLPEEDDPSYPLVLISCKSRFYLHSSYRWIPRLRRLRPHPKTEIHPETAERLGIRNGDEVVIETRLGAITQVAHVTERVHPRVICASYGWWFSEKETGTRFDWESSNFNMLTSAARLGKEFGTPNLKGIGCRIRPVPSQDPA